MFQKLIITLGTLLIISAPLAFAADGNDPQEDIAKLRDAAEKGDAQGTI